jgi:hypothetical protein
MTKARHATNKRSKRAGGRSTDKRTVSLTIRATCSENKMFLREVLATCEVGLPKPWTRVEVAASGGTVLVTLDRGENKGWLIYSMNASDLVDAAITNSGRAALEDQDA